MHKAIHWMTQYNQSHPTQNLVDIESLQVWSWIAKYLGLQWNG